MSFNPNRPVEIHVCYARERAMADTHWLRALKSEGTDKCTWILSTSGPSLNRQYEGYIQVNKVFNSRGIASTALLGTVSPRDVKKIMAAAKRVEPQHCQLYVVAVVAEIERKNLLPQGTTTRLRDKVERS